MFRLFRTKRSPRRRRETRDYTFEELFSEHLDALYRTALRLCSGQGPDAEDLLQETACKAFRRFSTLQASEAGRSWLFTILVRTHLNRERTMQRRSEAEIVDLDPHEFEEALEDWNPSWSPEALVDRERCRNRVRAVIDGLSPPLRAVIWLVDVEEFRQREVAAMLQISPGTVASRLYRGRKKLNYALEEEQDDRNQQYGA